MSLKELIQEASLLSVAERKQLIKVLVDQLVENEVPGKTQRNLRDFRGLGAHRFDGTDAQAYLQQIRSEWDDRG